MPISISTPTANIGATGLQIDSSAIDATEYTTVVTDTWATKKTLTFTPPNANCILLGLKLNCDMKVANRVNNGYYVEARVVITNPAWYSYADNAAPTTTTTTLSSSNAGLAGNVNGNAKVSDTAYRSVFAFMQTNSFELVTSANPDKLVAGNAAYTIEVQISKDTNVTTGYIKNIKVTAYWLNFNGSILTSSPKFT